VPGGEDQPSLNPGVSSLGPVGVLLLLPDPEGGDTQGGQGEWRFGGVGLDLAKYKLAADSLEL
jgi:hypothetical protein